MTDDLVQRLRSNRLLPTLPHEAADRIEALEAEVERLREALKRIQHFSPAHMWRAPDIKVIISAALQEQSK